MTDERAALAARHVGDHYCNDGYWYDKRPCDTARALALTEYTPVSEDEATSLLGEGIHTGLRKGTEASGSRSTWEAIAQENSGWDDAIRWAIDGLDFMGYVLCQKQSEKI